jgi:hypothetical protein
MKLFEYREVREAKAHALDGGQALHVFPAYKEPRAPVCFKRSDEWGHLLDQDEERLIRTAKQLGVRKIVVDQKGTERQHIDLCGAPLRRAKQRCENS